MYTILSITRQKTLHKYIRDVSAVCRVAKLLLKTVLLAVKVLRARKTGMTLHNSGKPFIQQAYIETSHLDDGYSLAG
jgi:hypothetical protein